MKNIFILGDSYSTFAGYNPEGYAVYYDGNVAGVRSVDQTWWHILSEKIGGRVIRNCSFSGTTICNTGYGGYCPGESFICRFDRLAEAGFFRENHVDELFILGGTNDTWVPSPVGSLKYDGWTEDDLKAALPAFCYLLHRVKECVPDARVVNILNDVVIGSLLAEGYREASAHYGADLVELGDFEMEDGHPTAAGMAEIAEKVAAVIEKR